MNIIDKIRRKQPLLPIEVTPENLERVVADNKFTPEVHHLITDAKDNIFNLNNLLTKITWREEHVEKAYIISKKVAYIKGEKRPVTRKVELSCSELLALVDVAKDKEIARLIEIVKHNLCTTCGEG